MKRRNILFAFLAVLTIFITGCAKKGYTEISYSDLNEMVDSKKTFALFIGKTSCTACDTFKGILKSTYKGEYSKEFTIYYIDLDKLSADEKIVFNSTYDFSSTPTVVIVVDGKFNTSNVVLDSTDDYDNMVEVFKNKGYIKG